MPKPPRLVLVLGDQLSEDVAALREGDPARDVVVMAEVMAEGASAPHHPKKVAFCLAAMRKFARRLEGQGWRVAYSRLDDPDNTHTIPGEVARRAAEHGAQECIATEPGEWRLLSALEACPVPVHLFADTRFLCPRELFEDWARGRIEGGEELRMEPFYRMMRERTGLLMEGARPAGGRWNLDRENRRPAPADAVSSHPLRHEPDGETLEVLDLVERRFPGRFGRLRPFWFATDREGALASLDHFARESLPRFGDHQDALRTGDAFLWHSCLSLYMNFGLLGPMEACEAVDAAWRRGRAPLNAAEGFVRQVIGWREYVRGVWALRGPGYLASNALGASRPLPPLYWGGETRMACMAAAVGSTRDEAYAHHIQRLMVTGAFALMAGVDPAAVHEWYLGVYADAVEWVEAPNVLGMSQWADGGLMASKPYACSGSYIARMGDHCGACAYDVGQKAGEGACPFNRLYWGFLGRHAERFRPNPRMEPVVRAWDAMGPARQRAAREDAAAFLRRLDAGEPV